MVLGVLTLDYRIPVKSTKQREESLWNCRKRKKFPLLPRVTGGTESVLPVPAGPSGQSERVRKNRAQVGSGYLRPGLVSVSDALVLGVLTLDYRIPNLSRKRNRVIPGNSDAEYGVRLHHEFGKWKSKRRNTRVYDRYGAIVVAGVKVKAGARVCVVCRGTKRTKKNGKKELLYV